MEKKVWVAPEIGAVQFQANEYVSACGSVTTTTYSATDWSPSYSSGSAYYLIGDSNQNNQIDLARGDDGKGFQYRDSLNSESLESLLDNYGGKITKKDADYTIFDSAWLQILDGPSAGNTNPFNVAGIHSGSHTFNSDEYSALYNGFIISASEVANFQYGNAQSVKYMYDSSTRLFHFFNSISSNILTSKTPS